MGNTFYYKERENDLGEMSNGRWRQVRRILPLMIDYINESMHEEWKEGVTRNVSIPGDKLDSSATVPEKKYLKKDQIFTDLSGMWSEVFIDDSQAIKTIFEWSDFLQKRDGAYQLYLPTLEALKQATYGIEKYWKET